MSLRADLEQWIVDALARLGGKGSIVEIAEDVCTNHEPAIRGYPKGLYTWQYDMRWSGQALQDQGRLRKESGVWHLITDVK